MPGDVPEKVLGVSLRPRALEEGCASQVQDGTGVWVPETTLHPGIWVPGSR